ncbi:antitoxin family protein [Candidatus Poribacteria bacterium]
MTKTIKARYRNGVIEPMEILEIPDGAEISVTINTTLPLSKEMKDGDWRRWRGVLTGTGALQKHEREHRVENS